MSTAKQPAIPVTKIDTYLTKHFRARAMRCRCNQPRCDALPPDPAFMAKLQRMRDLAGPLYINRGCSCVEYNDLVNGPSDSEHLFGRAAELFLGDLQQGDHLVSIARRVGMYGIGLGKTVIYVDDRKGPAAFWLIEK